MDRTARLPTSYVLAVLAATLLLATAGSAQPPGSGAGDMVAFEVQSVDRSTWVVTARDLESGETFSFRLPPEAFRGQRFRAELATASIGGKVSVQPPAGARLERAVIERPMRDEGSAAGPSPRPRFDRDGAASPLGDRGRSARPGAGAASDHPVHRVSGPTDYEVISVDPRTWVIEVRGRDGSAVSLEVDPDAFVGYRFRAAVENLRSGQGFELLASNETPLAGCCRVRARPGR